MKTLFIKILFLIIPVVLIFAGILWLVPPTKEFKKSLFFSQIDKDSLLKNTPSPRIIFIGGSNLSFGLDSRMIKDSLAINPINTAIHANLGLKYMLRNAMRYIRKNDIVIISPEYQQFYGGQANGNIELLSMIFDVSPDTKNLIDPWQCFKLMQYVPQYAVSKLNLITYFTPANMHSDTTAGIYSKMSFNAYGDAYKHWLLPKQAVEASGISGAPDNNVFDLLNEFRKNMELKKAKLFLTFPCYQDISFNKSFVKIKEIERKLNQHEFILLGTPERYKFPDSLIFNTPYHLTGKGVKLRTKLLIADIKKAI